MGIWLIPKIMKILDIWDFGHLVSERYPHTSCISFPFFFSLSFFFFFFFKNRWWFFWKVGFLWGFSDWIFGDAVGSMLVGL
jgi:hypothetical protein